MPQPEEASIDEEGGVPSPTGVLQMCGHWIKRTAIRIRDRMPWADQKDLEQQGIMTALELRERFDVARSTMFLTFVKPRVFGSMIDYLRREGAGRRGEVSIDSVPGASDVPTDTKDAVQIIIQHEETEALYTGVDALPEIERTVIALFYLEELTNKEISLVLNVSESYASRLRQQALARIAANIGATVA